MGDDILTLEQAVAWAADAHAGQKRASGNPYIVHPLRVMLSVSSTARIAAVLHDVLEDTDAGLPPNIDEDSAEAVHTLTRFPDDPYDAYVDDIASAPGVAGRIAREVKMADIRDNLMSDPGTLSVGRLITLRERYLRALEILNEAAPAPTQECKFCGSAYDYGECCPDCRRRCTCPWEQGMGPNLRCPIHGLLQHRMPLYKGTRH